MRGVVRVFEIGRTRVRRGPLRVVLPARAVQKGVIPGAVVVTARAAFPSRSHPVIHALTLENTLCFRFHLAGAQRLSQAHRLEGYLLRLRCSTQGQIGSGEPEQRRVTVAYASASSAKVKARPERRVKHFPGSRADNHDGANSTTNTRHAER